MKKRLLPLLLLAAAALPLFLQRRSTPEAIETRTLALATVYTTVSCPGTLEAYRTVTLSVPGTAVTEQVLINPGDRVQKGQLLLSYREQEEGDPVGELFRQFAVLLEGTGLPVELPDPTAAHDGCLEAPFDGRVLRIQAEEGMGISPVVGAVQLCDDSRMFARLRVSESELPSLRPGMPVRITGGAFSGTRRGVVIETSADVRTRFSLTGASTSYGEVLCELQDCSDLPVGSTLSATISVSRIRGGITVPYRAIDQDEAGNEYVYLLKDGRAEKRMITTAEDLGDEVRVSAGLRAGEVLILSGAEEMELQ